MSAETLPSEPSTADRPARERPRRLPFLWVLCVVSGLEGTFCLTAALYMKPLGIVYFGALALAFAGAAVGLYLRLRAGLYAALALCALWLVRLVLVGVRGQGVPVAGIVIAGLLTTLVALYFCLRRRHFGRAGVRRPRFLTAPGIVALAVVLALGGAFLLLMTVDDPRESFPALEAQVPIPPAKENGFLLVEQMRKKWRWGDDVQLEKVIEGIPKSSAAASPQWLKAARAELKKYEGCLTHARELAAMPHFVEVPRRTGMAWMTRSIDWMEFTRQTGRLLALSAAVQQADGHWAAALAGADQIVRLGALVGKESTGGLQNIVAMSVTAIGLNSLRSAAAAVPDVALLKGYLGPPFSEKQYRHGYDLGLAAEFQGNFSTVQAIRTPEYWAAEGYGPSDENLVVREGFFSLHMRATPLIKLNMTYNLLGRLVLPYVLKGDSYAQPPPNPLAEANRLFNYKFLARLVSTVVNGHLSLKLRPNPREASAILSTARSVGYLHFARNPVGDVILVSIAGALQGSWRASVRAIANIRLTQLFIALRCYRLQHGRLPAGLDALTPQYLKAVPLDPFTGRAFGYEPTGPKPRIWSVGPDRHTDRALGKGGDDVVVPLPFGEQAGRQAGQPPEAKR